MSNPQSLNQINANTQVPFKVRLVISDRFIKVGEIVHIMEITPLRGLGVIVNKNETKINIPKYTCKWELVK